MTSSSGPLFVGPDVASWQTVALVAQPTRPEEPKEDGGEGADFGKSSPVGLLVLLLFFIAVAFLVRSMTKHLKRVPASFDKPAEPSEPDEPTSSAESAESTEPTESADSAASAEEKK
jgi:hypothetical protein